MVCVFNRYGDDRRKLFFPFILGNYFLPSAEDAPDIRFMEGEKGVFSVKG